MSVDIDFDKCEGHGMCALIAPDVFDLDDEGNVRFVARPTKAQWPEVVQAAQTCPTQAIRTTGDA